MSGASTRTLAALLGLCFFASGAAALTFEALWFRQAGLAFGNSIWASSLVLAGFMGGMSLGNLAAARYAARVSQPIRAYAVLELAVAVLGSALVYVLPELSGVLAPLTRALASAPAAQNALRFALALLLLCAPAAAMGATLPLLSHALGRRDLRFGRVLGFLYGANTLGAVAGVLATELATLSAFGIRGSALWAAGLCAVAASGAWLLLRPALDAATDAGQESAPRATEARIENVEVREASSTQGSATGASQPQPGRARFLVAAGLAGFALLSLEVSWLRHLMLFLNDTPLLFASVLALVLAGIGLGGWLGSLLYAAAATALRHAAAAAYAAGLGVVGGLLLYPFFLQRFIRSDQDVFTVVLVALPMVVPTSLASGALFTAIGAGLRSVSRSDAEAAGLLAFVNTLGAALGPLVTGFVLLPRLGMDGAIACAVGLYGIAGLLLCSLPTTSALSRYGATAVFVVGVAFFPFGDAQEKFVRASVGRWMDRFDEIVEVREGVSATIVHVRHGYHGLHVFDQLAQNAYSMTVDDFAARRYMKLFVYLPRAIHPEIQRALIVGYGMGNTAQAVTESDELLELDVVDISADMIDLARRLKPRRGEHPLQDKRTTLYIDDGRNFLEATDQRYDLITGEPPPPIIAGVESLYSTEYFALVRSRLAHGGIATYWLPTMNISVKTTKAIIAAFCEAFDDCTLWHGSARNLMLMGTRDAGGPVDEQRFAAQWMDPEVREELTAVGFEFPGQLGATFIGDAPYLRQLTEGSEPLTDDRPKRMHQPGTTQERDQLLWRFRDTTEARKRFEQSAWVARFFPDAARRSARHNFENQRLINDLLFPGKTPARQTRVLHQVLSQTRLQLPILLILGSDPDIQQALEGVSPEQRKQPALAVHVAAGKLAQRDLEGAMDALSSVPDDLLPLANLRRYLAYTLAQNRPAP